MSFKDKWNHAFALAPDISVVSGPLPDILEKFAQMVVAKKMETPAILFLEMVRPLNFLGSQLVFASVPIAGLFTGERELKQVATALAHRESIRRVVDRIEELSRQQNRTNQSHSEPVCSPRTNDNI